MRSSTDPAAALLAQLVERLESTDSPDGLRLSVLAKEFDYDVICVAESEGLIDVQMVVSPWETCSVRVARSRAHFTKVVKEDAHAQDFRRDEKIRKGKQDKHAYFVNLSESGHRWSAQRRLRSRKTDDRFHAVRRAIGDREAEWLPASPTSP